MKRADIWKLANLLVDVILSGKTELNEESAMNDIILQPLVDNKKIKGIFCLCEKLLNSKEAFVIKNRYGFNQSGCYLTYSEIREAGLSLLNCWPSHVQVIHKEALLKLYRLGYKRERWFYELYRSGCEVDAELQRQEYAWKNLTGNALVKALAETKLEDFRDYELFPTAAKNCLKNNGYITLAELVNQRECYLMGMKNMGVATLQKIKDILAKSNLKLEMISIDDWHKFQDQ